MRITALALARAVFGDFYLSCCNPIPMVVTITGMTRGELLKTHHSSVRCSNYADVCKMT